MPAGYEEIAAAIADAYRGTAGSDSERQASAALLAAAIYREMAALVRALHREELIDATLYENGGSVTFRQNGVSVTVQRFSAQCRLRIDLSGFDPSLVTHEQRVSQGDVAARTIEECAQIARSFVQALGQLVREEHVRRGVR